MKPAVMLLNFIPLRCDKGFPIGMSSAASRSVIAGCTVPKQAGHERIVHDGASFTLTNQHVTMPSRPRNL